MTSPSWNPFTNFNLFPWPSLNTPKGDNPNQCLGQPAQVTSSPTQDAGSPAQGARVVSLPHKQGPAPAVAEDGTQIQSKEVMALLLKHDEKNYSVYQNGISGAELKEVLADLKQTAIKSGLVTEAASDTEVLAALKAHPEAMAPKVANQAGVVQDLDLLGRYAGTTFEPNQLVLPAVIAQGSPQTRVAAYSAPTAANQDPTLRAKEAARELKEVYGKGYGPHPKGCEAMTDTVHSAVLGQDLHMTEIFKEFGTALPQSGDAKDTHFNRTNILKMIQDHKLKPGMVLFINSDPEMKLDGEAGPGKNLSDSDRHWFTYAGVDKSGEPIFLDNIAKRRPLDQMLNNFPENLNIADKFVDFLAEKGYDTHAKRTQLRDTNNAELKQLRIEYRVKIYQQKHQGASEDEAKAALAKKYGPNNMGVVSPETGVYDNPANHMVIHTLVDPYSDDPAAPNARDHFKTFATEFYNDPALLEDRMPGGN